MSSRHSMNTTNKIIMTGGTGFVGTWMERKKPPNTKMLVINSMSYPYKWEFKKCDYIIHLAPVSPALAIGCARRNNARLLFASSGAVYHPEYQDKEYRDNKIKWEQECLDSGVDVVIARLFTFMDSSRVWNAVFDAARKGDLLPLWGNCTRSFMHGSEMARWMWAILLRGESRQAYSVGSDRAITISDFVERVSKFTGCWIDTKEYDIPMPIYLPPNTQKTRALL